MIVEEEVASFHVWLNSLVVVPTIMALRKHFQEVMDAELDRAKLADLTDEQKAGVAEQRKLTLEFNKATIGLLSEEQRAKAGVKLPGTKKKKPENK